MSIYFFNDVHFFERQRPIFKWYRTSWFSNMLLITKSAVKCGDRGECGLGTTKWHSQSQKDVISITDDWHGNRVSFISLSLYDVAVPEAASTAVMTTDRCFHDWLIFQWTCYNVSHERARGVLFFDTTVLFCYALTNGRYLIIEIQKCKFQKQLYIPTEKILIIFWSKKQYPEA